MENLQDKQTQEQIHKKGFSFIDSPTTDMPVDYNKIKIGLKTLIDATIDLNPYTKVLPSQYCTKEGILRALAEKNYSALRAISDHFYDMSGIYRRVCNYLAELYRYDWYVAPEVLVDEINEDKLVSDFNKTLNFLDNSYLKKMCGDIALKVVKYGCYYGYIIESKDRIILQELPAEYCRCLYHSEGLPVVEFNMAFFDDRFPDADYREKILKMFPEEFAKGYKLYKKRKLEAESIYVDPADRDWFYRRWSIYGWYPLTPGSVIKFNLNGSDIPTLVSAIPEIIDLDGTKALDRRRQMQQLLKIIVQKLPRDKNGDLIFDVDEARDIHNNAVAMLRRAIGVDVLTTFADVDLLDISDNATADADEDLANAERSVYNDFGVSRNLFNTDGNLSLEKSILDDESTMRDLIIQFNMFFSYIVNHYSTNRRKYIFRFYMLETTQYNYKEMAKMYKEQTQVGYSKMLPQIALGHSQSMILNTAFFENTILHLSAIMVPPLMSSTLSSNDILDITGQNIGSNSNVVKTDGTEKQVGRPEKEESEKSDKTIANEESMN